MLWEQAVQQCKVVALCCLHLLLSPFGGAHVCLHNHEVQLVGDDVTQSEDADIVPYELLIIGCRCMPLAMPLS